jgi:hypothetical protein
MMDGETRKEANLQTSLADIETTLGAFTSAIGFWELTSLLARF